LLIGQPYGIILADKKIKDNKMKIETIKKAQEISYARLSYLYDLQSQGCIIDLDTFLRLKNKEIKRQSYFHEKIMKKIFNGSYKE
jgi:hypothetical protein